jgi:hypothetical protein
MGRVRRGSEAPVGGRFCHALHGPSARRLTTPPDPELLRSYDSPSMSKTPSEQVKTIVFPRVFKDALRG